MSDCSPPFWQVVPLQEMVDQQWESLCDGCGKCCLHKIEDEETDQLYFTRVACEYLDVTDDTCRCRDYANRKINVPSCMDLQNTLDEALPWLPATCAYRLLAEGGDLPEWHPLRHGSSELMHQQGNSVLGYAISEENVHPDSLDEHILTWVTY